MLKIKIYLIFDVFDFLSMLVKFFREIFLNIWKLKIMKDCYFIEMKNQFLSNFYF